MNKLIIPVLCLTLFPACAEFEPGSSIVEPRVLGVHVQVEGASQRSSPRPGETAELALITAAPLDVVPVYRWSLSVCVAASAASSCLGEPLATEQGESVAPTLRLSVPSASELGSAHSLRLFGVVCSTGEPMMEPTGGHCTGDAAHGTPMSFELELDRGQHENLQPQLEQTTFALDELDWPESAETPSSCADRPALRQVKADEKEHHLSIVLGPSARETYLDSAQQPVREELELSQFVTAGELSRQFSFVDPNDASERPAVKLTWTAPKRRELASDSELVRLLVLVRDQRGGIAQVERWLCVVH